MTLLAAGTTIPDAKGNLVFDSCSQQSSDGDDNYTVKGDYLLLYIVSGNQFAFRI